MCVYMCVCVCVCEREREREREGVKCGNMKNLTAYLVKLFSNSYNILHLN